MMRVVDLVSHCFGDGNVGCMFACWNSPMSKTWAGNARC
jgi:hypothetical protein